MLNYYKIYENPGIALTTILLFCIFNLTSSAYDSNVLCFVKGVSIWMAYQYTNSKGDSYYLHAKQVQLRGSGKTQTIYYFAREVDKDNSLEEVPEGYKVVESPRTGLPILKKT